MYDEGEPTEKELLAYFTTWIDNYAMEFHKKQAIEDVEIAKEEEENKVRWWNEEK